MNLRKELIKEMEKSLKIINEMPLRHPSWNKQVWEFREYLEDNIIEEREAIINCNHIWEENILKEIDEYKLLNSGSNWMNRLILREVYRVLEKYAKSLKSILYYNNISYHECLKYLRFDTVKFTDKKSKKLYLSRLSDFCVRGDLEFKKDVETQKSISRKNNENKQESLFITFMNHHKSNKYNHLKDKHIALFSKEDILDWKEKVEEIFEEGYTDMYFSYELCLPYKPLDKYYYTIKNPKKGNWEKKLMKEIKEG